MALIYFPALSNSFTFSIKGSQASRFNVPGIPPGSTIISTSLKSISFNVLSMETVIP